MLCVGQTSKRLETNNPSALFLPLQRAARALARHFALPAIPVGLCETNIPTSMYDSIPLRVKSRM